MESSLKRKTVSGVVWSSLERFSVQGIQFVIMIVMARILSPSDYGLIGMLTVFLAVSQSLIDSGFSQALIRKQDRTEVDNSTVFYFNFVVGLVLYLILFVTAPYIASFYNIPELTSVTRVISLSVFINSLVVVQRALLTSKIDFKTQAKASFIAALFSGTIGITMAYKGFGVWSLVAQQIIDSLINTLLLWFFSKWRPLKIFSWISFQELFSFGSKLLASGLLGTVYNNLYIMVIGKFFSASDLGYYTRAYQFSAFPSSNLTETLQRVTYPALCNLQDDNIRLAAVYRRMLRVFAFIIFPLLIGLAAVAKPLVLLLLTEKWSFTAVLLQVICFSMMWYPIHAINLNLLQVKGRSDLFLRLEIIKKCIGVLTLCITIPMGLISICIGSVFSSLIALALNTYYTGKLINVGFFRQMRDLYPILFYSLTMGGLVYYVIQFITSNALQLIVGIVLGIIYYLSISFLFKSKELKELLQIIKRK